ncbi:hypothetical protein QRX46_03380 [Bifidobacterium sp. H1HS10N]|uniref:hypothetical protein n=1 Tax=Bifidobacterium kimbladii TaxID=1293826 RepID=UPI0028BD5524|nr:hypothetical protein [Bifidobacterium sp. H1HS10N]MDT7512467.1 hypothetical protein [Bifidobacterium sp. H1HS10N]
MTEQIGSCNNDPHRKGRVILHHHHGFGPVREVGVKEAIWITPGLLIAQNAWLASQGRPSWALSAPPTLWLDELDQSLTERRILTVTAETILTWRRLPSGLGQRPWSQLVAGRVSGLPAARRTLEGLQSDLRTAPAQSLIRIQTHLPNIHEEWRVIIDRDRIAASSGYCLHEDEGSRAITTVFDGAIFDPRHRTIAENCALQAAKGRSPAPISVDLAFLRGSDRPLVLEGNPVWCAAPYAYGPQGMVSFLKAVATCRTDPVDPYQPDPWMLREFGGRFRSSWGPTRPDQTMVMP